MKISTSLSHRIKVISLISMIMVMYIHSINIYSNSAEVILDYSTNLDSQLVVFIQLFISDGIARVAVPLFFMISGYLYFFNLCQFTQIYRQKVPNRIKSLIIPYIFWSILVILIFIFLQAMPYSGAFFNGKHVLDFSFIELVNALLITPLNYPLWFLRDLIVVVFIYSPLIFISLKFSPRIFLSVLLILWLSNIDQVESYKWFLRLTALFFFSLGGYLSFYKKNIEAVISKKHLIISIFMYMLLLLLKTILQMNPIYIDSYLVRFLLKIDILIGIPVLWTIILYFKNSRVIKFLTPFTFLYYVFQEPFMSITKKASFFLLGFNTYSSLFVYILTPMIAVVFLTSLGILMKKYMPKVTKVITGNRL
jgi:surface polysaccharide O-acyltransferase-like enzyme